MAAIALSLTLSALPIHRYPSSPLVEFPPPMPVNHRRPLRERCGFDLQIKTAFMAPLNSAPRVLKGGHVQPTRSNLPRRKKGSLRIVIDEESIAPELVSEPVTKPVIPQHTLPEVDESLQELIPGLFVAFKPAGEKSDMQRLLAQGYTHLVDICYPTSSSDEFAAGSCEQSTEGDVQKLCLTLPFTAQNETGRAGLALTDAQLRTVRDFLAQAFPYSLVQDIPVGAIRVLIATPPRRITDAMCVAGCYLAFASGKSVGTVLRYIDDEESVLSVWKGEVSENEADKTERVARLWSWLSNIRK